MWNMVRMVVWQQQLKSGENKTNKINNNNNRKETRSLWISFYKMKIYFFDQKGVF